MRKKRNKIKNLFQVRVLPVLVLFGVIMLLFNFSAVSSDSKNEEMAQKPYIGLQSTDKIEQITNYYLTSNTKDVDIPKQAEDNNAPKVNLSGITDGALKDKGDLKIEVTDNRNLNKVAVETEDNGSIKTTTYDASDKSWSRTLSYTNTGHYKVKVTAEDQAGNKTNKSISFTIDNTNPKINISGISNNNYYQDGKTVTVTITEPNFNKNKTNIKVHKKDTVTGTTETINFGGSGSWEKNRDGQWVLSHKFSAEVQYNITVDSTDNAGNSASKSATFTIDKSNPKVSITGVENGGKYDSKKATFKVSDKNLDLGSTTLTITKDGNSYNAGKLTLADGSKTTAQLTHNFSEKGKYQIKLTAKDKAGRTAVKEVSFTIGSTAPPADKTKPMISISGVKNGQSYNSNKKVTLKVTDQNLDSNKVTVKRNGKSYNAGGFSVSGNTATLTHTFSGEGKYEISVQATDKSGNSSSKKTTFTIDKTAPVISPIISGENRIIKNGEYFNRFFTVNFSLDKKADNIISVNLNGRNVGKSTAITSEGNYHFKVTARDKAGNESVRTVSFTVDVTPPDLDISGIVEGYFNEDAVPEITYSDKNLDRQKTSVTLNGEPYESGTKIEKEQDYTLEARIVDLAGNVTEETIDFTIDKSAPVIKFMEPISEQYFNTAIIPELMIEDMSDYEILGITLDGEPYEIGDPIEGQGKRTLYFEVKDKAGNIQELAVEFNIDTTPPKIIFEGAENNEEYYDPVHLRISLENPQDRIQTVKVNGELYTGEVTEIDGKKFLRIDLTQIGSYEIEVIAVDEPGNKTEEVISFEIAEKTSFIKFYENKPLFAGSIVGVVALLGAAGTFIYRLIRKRKQQKEIADDYFN